MKFHCEFDIKKLSKPIDYRNNLFLMGSCFTESMGDKLRKLKFSILENPNGILFNPVSVAEAIDSYLEKKQIIADDLFKLNETWHSWNHHSRLSGITQMEVLSKINTTVIQAHDFLKKTNYLMITLGSVWVYTFTHQAANSVIGNVAANNHKAPASWFLKKLMTVEETLTIWEELLKKIFLFNPNLTIIFTISPVRHLREGVIENNRSKAVLIQTVHQLVEQFENVYYFPAYELVIDDLRDYRFYAEDLVHPNYQATQYVWEKFTESCMNEEAKSLMKEIAEINLAFQHKPLNNLTIQHQHFLANYSNKTKVLQSKYPFLDFAKELNYFENNG